ncbi:hypothetical protein ACFWBS_44810, partial [Streptomyces mirabilis]
ADARAPFGVSGVRLRSGRRGRAGCSSNGSLDDVGAEDLARMRPADRDGEEQPARPCARGRVGGQPTVVNTDILRAARDVLPNPERSITSIANLSGSALARSTTASPTSGSAAPPWR